MFSKLGWGFKQYDNTECDTLNMIQFLVIYHGHLVEMNRVVRSSKSEFSCGT